MTSRTLLSLALLCTLPTARAEPIVADRPGFSTGTYTVRPGHYNVELGFQGSRDGRSLPLTNVRIGSTTSTEVEVQWGGWTFANGSSTVNNLTLGGKYRLLDSDDLKLSLLGLLNLPSGNGNAAGSKAAPQLSLLWSRKELFGMLQLASSNPGTLQTQAQAAIGYSYAIDDSLSSYVELYADHPLNHSGNDVYMMDGGYAWLLNESTQLDLHIGLDLNGNAAHFIGMGYARSY